MMRLFILGFFVLLFVPISARAASFDCTKVTVPVEKIICADPALSKADEELALAYKQSLAASLNQDWVKSGQVDWLKGRNATETPSALLKLYQARITELQHQATIDHDAHLVTGTDLTAVCVDFSGKWINDCIVRESGLLGDPTQGLVFQLRYFGDNEHNMGSSVVILKTISSNPLQYEIKLLVDDDDSSLDAPYFADAAQHLLVIRGSANLTHHHYRTDHLYWAADGFFELINVDSWQEELSEATYECESIGNKIRTVGLHTWILRNNECYVIDQDTIVRVSIKDHKLVPVSPMLEAPQKSKH